jgi:hypothetical protein
MTTIDHRILIPAAPDVVWNYVSDITHNPDWQVDCTDVIFLTSRREGPGMRWRYAAPGGHEMVVAVTAWYNGLGYEYYFVDGVPFRENKGRIRLQEIPEGTIVQWTFTYDLGGVLGGVRDSFGLKRQIDRTIADSLKTLWQKIKESGGSSRTLEPKSLMREAPDVEARSAYQPRHPSVVDMEASDADKPLRLSPSRLKAEPPIEDEDARSFPVIEEPPVVEDDTRPRSPFAPPEEPVRPVTAQSEPDFLDAVADEDLVRFEPPRRPAAPPTEAAAPVAEAEPDFLDGIDEVEAEIDLARFEPPRDPSDTQPRRATLPEPSPEPQESPAEYTEAFVEFRSTTEETEPLPAQPETTFEQAPEADDPAESSEQVTLPSAAAELDEDTQLEWDGEATIQLEDLNLTAATPAEPETQTSETATTHSPAASIWEIFGVQRPSETQEIQQLEVEPRATEPEAADAALKTEAQAEAEADLSETATAVSAPVRVAATVEVQPISSRTGLRIIQRRKSVRLRLP